MITVSEAYKLINTHHLKPEIINMDFRNSLHHVLAQDIVATDHQPPFDRVTMDGIAISWKEWKEGSRQFAIVDFQKAGEKAKTLSQKNSAIEVMTGSILPLGVDCVIPFEDLFIENNKAFLSQDLNLNLNQNIHPKGTDYLEGKILLEKNTVIESNHMAIIASQGFTSIKVYKKPKIAIFSTGDELIEPGSSRETHQIYRSNPYALKALLNEFKFFDIELFHLSDDIVVNYQLLDKLLTSFEVFIFSGAVSKGKLDYLPELLQNIKVEVIFHGVRQRPGKPMWFGHKNFAQLFFALPGNPISCFSTLRKYVIPNLLKCAGFPEIKEKTIRLSEPLKLNNKLVNFIAVELKDKTHPHLMNTSGDFYCLYSTQGMIEVDPTFPDQIEVPYYSWKDL